MLVIAVSTLRAFWERYPDAEQPLKAWYEEATSANWSQPADIKAQYRSASVLKNRRVVFNIKGNDCRLIVAVAYKLQIVYVKIVGAHSLIDTVSASVKLKSSAQSRQLQVDCRGVNSLVPSECLAKTQIWATNGMVSSPQKPTVFGNHV